MMTLSLWLIDKGHTPGISPLTHGAWGVGEPKHGLARTMDTSHFLTALRVLPPAAGSSTPVWHPPTAAP